MSKFLPGVQAHSSLSSNISRPALVHLSNWQEEVEEEDEDEQEIFSGSTSKQVTGSGCWSALGPEVYMLSFILTTDVWFVVLYTKTNWFFSTRDTSMWHFLLSLFFFSVYIYIYFVQWTLWP